MLEVRRMLMRSSRSLGWAPAAGYRIGVHLARMGFDAFVGQWRWSRGAGVPHCLTKRGIVDLLSLLMSNWRVPPLPENCSSSPETARLKFSVIWDAGASIKTVCPSRRRESLGSRRCLRTVRMASAEEERSRRGRRGRRGAGGQSGPFHTAPMLQLPCAEYDNRLKWFGMRRRYQALSILLEVTGVRLVREWGLFGDLSSRFGGYGKVGCEDGWLYFSRSVRAKPYIGMTRLPQILQDSSASVASTAPAGKYNNTRECNAL